jgi:glycosyltransferase involved in cell wall biosynthesis
VSRELAEDAALRFGLPEDRLEVINVGYNGDIFRPCDPAERAAARKRAGFHEDRFTVLFIGTLEPRKGLETLLEALEGLGAEMPVELCVVGIGPSEAALKALANRHRLRDHIHWLGARPHDDLWELYAAADAFVLPSYREGTPTVMLEAMASGTPVVLTDVGGVPDVVRHEQNGLLFRPGDVGACRAMIERVVRDSSLARRISRQALEDIQEHSLSRQVERIEAIYRSGSALRRFRTQRR